MKYPALAAALLLLASWGQGERIDTHPTPPNEIEVTGTIAMTGNDPFLKLVIQTEGGPAYEIIGDFNSDLAQRQAQTVKVRGRVEKEARGPGFPAQLRVTAILD